MFGNNIFGAGKTSYLTLEEVGESQHAQLANFVNLVVQFVRSLHILLRLAILTDTWGGCDEK